MSTEANKKTTQRLRQGTVLKNRTDKTVVVEVTRRFRHRKYMKFVRRRTRYAAHDERNECNVGDVVLLEESRPLSKTKRWRVREIVQRATGV